MNTYHELIYKNKAYPEAIVFRDGLLILSLVLESYLNKNVENDVQKKHILNLLELHFIDTEDTKRVLHRLSNFKKP